MKNQLATLSLLAALTFTSAAQAQMMGSFVAGDRGHGGEGTAAIAMSNGGYELQLKGLKTDPGPDLEVILIEAKGAVTTNSIKQSNWVSLGQLKSVTGDQTYDIPSNLDVSKYHTVAVWCESYSVLFTAAPLGM